MTRRDHLEPTAVRLRMAGGAVSETTVEAAAVEVIEGIAGACEEAGASVIGHIKSHGIGGGRRFRCNLTSVRTGADFEWMSSARGGDGGEDRTAEGSLRRPGDAHSQSDDLELTLVVLVYGLDGAAVFGAVRRALENAVGGVAGLWAAEPIAAEHDNHGEH